MNTYNFGSVYIILVSYVISYCTKTSSLKAYSLSADYSFQPCVRQNFLCRYSVIGVYRQHPLYEISTFWNLNRVRFFNGHGLQQKLIKALKRHYSGF